MSSLFFRGALAIAAGAFLVACSQEPAATKKHPAAVASAHPLATQAGITILNQGGNAFDAAVATAAVLAVVEPYSAGMGGGGFWLLHDAKQNKDIFVDAREKAPLKAHRDMYLDANGDIIPKLSIDGPMAAGIPGQAAAFAHLAEHYGNLPLSQSLSDAIRIANEGFTIDQHYQKLAGYRLGAMNKDATTRDIFLQNGDIPKEGFIVKQPQLANTLTLLAAKGFDGFYQGEVAKQLVSDVNAAGGIWQLEDLSQYKVIEREPIKTQYTFQGKTFDITSAAPPSSGGIAIAQMFQMLEHLKQSQNIDWSKLDNEDQTHLLSEVMRRAYFDRAHYLGDPDFVDVPQAKLLNPDYNAKLAGNIMMDTATVSADMGSQTQIYEGFHTTHLSVLDSDGNRVSATLSINLPFGSAFTSKQSGVLLNNEMDDFSSKPGVPNAYGLVGNEANAIAPGKRPLSSMTPSFVSSDDGVAILGTPGGSRIITMVFLGMLEHLQGRPVEDWVARPRFHHQYLPDVIQHEPNTFTEQEKAALKKKGHQLKDVGRTYGNMHAVLLEGSKVTAASDSRGVGQALVSTEK